MLCSISVLESDNSYISPSDDAKLNAMLLQQRSGVRTAEDCSLYLGSGYITVGTGDLIISGFRVTLTSTCTCFVNLGSYSGEAVLVAKLYKMSSSSFSLDISAHSYTSDFQLIQDDLFNSSGGYYEIVFAKFSISNSIISNLRRVVPVLDSIIPAISPEDAGKFLRVSSAGQIILETIPIAEVSTFG